VEAFRDSILNVLFVAGVIAAALSLLDLFLSDKQKASLANTSLNIWNWVDEAKRVSIFGHFVTPKWQRIVMLMSAAIGILGISYYLTTIWSPGVREVVLVIIITIVSLYIDWNFFHRVIGYISASNSAIAYTLKSCAVMLACGLIAGTVHKVGALLFINLPYYIGWSLVIPLGIVILLMLFLFAQVFIILLISVGVAILIFLTYVLLYPLEIIMRRIAEYPKGPILAVSTLAAGIAALAKVFT
jgi:hypothetical protein